MFIFHVCDKNFFNYVYIQSKIFNWLNNYPNFKLLENSSNNLKFQVFNAKQIQVQSLYRTIVEVYNKCYLNCLMKRVSLVISELLITSIVPYIHAVTFISTMLRFCILKWHIRKYCLEWNSCSCNRYIVCKQQLVISIPIGTCVRIQVNSFFLANETYKM